MEEVEVVAEGLEFPEGPVWLPDGSVLVVEVRRGTLTRVSPSCDVDVVADCGGGPNGAAVGPEGKVYVCNNGGFEWSDELGLAIPGMQPADYIGGRIQRVDLLTGEVEDLYTECAGHPLRGPNDLVFDDQGGFWFTDHGKNRPRERDHGGVTRPAGCDSARDRLTRLPTVRLPRRRGRRQRVRRHARADTGPHLVSPEGEVEAVALPRELWDPLTTNICFGGDDLRTAFVTLSGTGRLARCRWPRPGLGLAFAAIPPTQ